MPRSLAVFPRLWRSPLLSSALALAVFALALADCSDPRCTLQVFSLPGRTCRAEPGAAIHAIPRDPASRSRPLPARFIAILIALGPLGTSAYPGRLHEPVACARQPQTCPQCLLQPRRKALGNGVASLLMGENVRRQRQPLNRVWFPRRPTASPGRIARPHRPAAWQHC